MMKLSKPAMAAAAALAISAQPLLAGGMAEPVMEPEVVAKEAASSSSAAILIPILLLVLIAAAASGGNTPVEGG